MTTRTTRIFQSTLPARGATFVVKVARPLTGISIHAPREGSDACKVDTLKELCISIHAPREGSDLFQSTIRLTCSLFQSTLPARGATDR